MSDRNIIIRSSKAAPLNQTMESTLSPGACLSLPAVGLEYTVADASGKPLDWHSDNKKVPDGWAAPCRPKPATSKFLEKNIAQAEGMCFQTMPEALAIMACTQWLPPADDTSIPHTDQDLRKYARKLVDAFKNMDFAKDTADNAYRKRMTPGKKEYFNDWAIENCAWHVLKLVKELHVNGFKVPIYDRALMDSIGQTQRWTFEERINWICLVLATSKSIAATLMKHEKIWTVIGAPHKLYNSTLVNTESNANRNRWVKDGRARDPTHAPNRSRLPISNPNLDQEVAEPKRRRIEPKSIDSGKTILSILAGRPKSVTTAPSGMEMQDQRALQSAPGEIEICSVPVVDNLTCRVDPGDAKVTHASTSAAPFPSSVNGTSNTKAPSNTPEQVAEDVEMTDAMTESRAQPGDARTSKDRLEDPKVKSEHAAKPDVLSDSSDASPSNNAATIANEIIAMTTCSTDEMDVAMTLASLHNFPASRIVT